MLGRMILSVTLASSPLIFALGVALKTSLNAPKEVQKEDSNCFSDISGMDKIEIDTTKRYVTCNLKSFVRTTSQTKKIDNKSIF